MAKLRIALVLMVLFVASAKWWKQSHVSAESPATPKAPTTIASQTAPSPIDGQPQPVSSKPPEHHELDENAQSIIRDCLKKTSSLPRVHFSNHLSLENVLEDLNSKTESSVINIHVRRPDGKEERLHVSPHDPSTPNAFGLAGQDVTVFDVDNEGLPVPKPFPHEFKQDTLLSVINSFTGRDATTFKERRSQHSFSGGSAFSVEKDGRLTELQLNFGHHVLGCADQDLGFNCKCL